MPARFYSKKRRLISEGMSAEAAAGKAARITNAHLKRGEKAVGSGHKKKKKKHS